MSYRSASARAAAFDQAVREAMSASIPNAVDPQDAPASYPAAGTPRPERITVRPTAEDRIVITHDPTPRDDDRVKHTRPYFESVWHTYPDGSGGWTSPDGKRQLEAQDAETYRKARLRRWQETRG